MSLASCAPFHSSDDPNAQPTVLTIATASNAPVGISVGGDSLYRGENSDRGRVFSAPKRGGAAPLLWGDGPNLLPWTSSAGQTVFWIDDTQGNCDEGTGLFQRPLGAAAPTRLLSCTDVLKSPVRIAADALDVFWTKTGRVCGSSRTSPNAFCAPLPSSAADPNNPFPGAIALALSSAYVFFSFDGGIMRAPKDLQSTSLHVSGNAAPPALVADDEHLYYALPGAVMRVPIDPAGAQSETFADRQPEPLALATFGNSVYWAANDGAIRVLQKSGGTPRVLASGQAGVTSIATDTNGVYWATSDKAVRGVIF
jgi:hypothetical protein